jgi:hypothetical protein
MGTDPWTAAMERGEFLAAWQVSDAILLRRQVQRIDCSRWPRHEQFIWNGAPFTGRRVLVRCYHGLGDTLQFVRLLPLLRAQARQVTLWVQPPLLELLRGVAGADQLLPLHDGVPRVDYDVDVELMELAHALRLVPEQIPAPPYLHVAPFEQQGQQEHAAGQRHVGIAWLGGSWNAQRSIEADLLLPLADLAHLRWHSLQFGIARPPLGAAVVPRQDVLSIARYMHTLDLVISVDTMTAHLAGAMGIPTWTLLPRPCDWRWLDSGAATPWYPSMRLFRQRTSGDWREVIEDVRQALLDETWSSALSTQSAAASSCASTLR